MGNGGCEPLETPRRDYGRGTYYGSEGGEGKKGFLVQYSQKAAMKEGGVTNVRSVVENARRRRTSGEQTKAVNGNNAQYKQALS